MLVYFSSQFLFLFFRDVELPFQWVIYKPDMTETDELDKKADRVPDVDSVFSVHPPSGILPPADEMEFKITFAPPVVRLQFSREKFFKCFM
jgi:hypothetical protein